MAQRWIAVRGASEHNLRHIDVDIPIGQLTAVTGVSGSGKSSLVFDTVAAEGRRRYLETYSSYTRQFLGRAGRPVVGRIDGLAPAVALDQGTTVRTPRSTVGTLSEVYDLLRLAWSRFGDRPGDWTGPRPSRQLFSFNSPLGACAACQGLGVEDRLDPELLVADPARTVRGGALRVSTPNGYLIYSQVTIDVLDAVCQAHGFSVDVPWRDLTGAQRDVILNGSDRIRIPYGKHPLASRMKWTGITAKPREEGVYKGILPVMQQILRQKRNDNILRFVRSMPCAACGGTRLGPRALGVTVGGRSIADAAALTPPALRAFLRGVPGLAAAAEVRRAIDQRCEALEQLGLGYLAFDRESTSLSGGEAQRLRLARQLSVGLTNVLYVFDEPSVGLHPADTARLLAVLRTLRDRGNTVVVVEHDADLIAGADFVVEIGPGAGRHGGTVTYAGPAPAFLDRRPAAPAADGRPAPARRAGTGTLRVTNLTTHNLRRPDVTFLFGALNVVTGVSGAGKSTLVDETCRLVPAGRNAGTGPVAPGGAPRAECSRAVSRIVAIDQSPIGRTPRSNPATYTGVFDLIRDLFAAEPDAVRLGYGKSRFSFNVSGGRCEACEGAGVRQVGMQFLGTVSVPCDGCGGRRFHDDTLAVRHRGASIHDVLAMEIDDACAFFAHVPAAARTLGALRALGLGYLPLGHPATMLSGGEAQRVKLATALAAPPSGHTLYVLDEPTTGLHDTDVARLLEALDALVQAGHTVVAVEHHPAVMAAADRVIDLGPGQGIDGGRLVVAGTPEEVAACGTSATAPALRAALGGERPSRPADAGPPAAAADVLHLHGVTTNNLAGVTVHIPHDRLTVVTGVSGSGKSSLAFDTLAVEGRNRYAESLSAWARRFVRQPGEAEFEDIQGLRATVAIAQQAPSRNPRSTVATLTEIHDDYRLLFSRFGERRCPSCAAPMAGRACGACGCAGVPVLTAAMFSPNSEAGACPACHGLGHEMTVAPDRLITDPSRPLAAGAMAGHKAGRFYGDPSGQHMAALRAAAAARGLDVSPPWSQLAAEARHLALHGAGDETFRVEWTYARGTRTGIHAFTGRWAGLLDLVRQEYLRTHGDDRGRQLEALMVPVPCAACEGARLKPEPRAVRFCGRTIAGVLRMTVDESASFFRDIEAGRLQVDASTLGLSAPLRADIVRRLDRLRDAGLGYLGLDRTASTLSAGEAQRVRLASQVQSGLTGITCVLDEPTAGLHPRDTRRLVALLRDLRDAGNTVVVVEHDLDVIGAADHVVELGPGAGADGGRVVAEGPPAAITASPASPTGAALRAASQAGARRPRPLGPGLAVRGADVHNLQALDVDVPSGGLVVISGVSGSGKSTLVLDVVLPSLQRVLALGAAAAPVGCARADDLAGFEAVADIRPAATITSPWSTPATQTGVFDVIRDVFAASERARALKLKKAHFSTTTRGGRCAACDGLGESRVSLDVLPDAWTACDECGGTGYGPDVLACRVDGLTIAEALRLRVTDAPRLAAVPGLSPKGRRILARGLDALRDAGLGYLTLGQRARTLSGGERQRLVLASALASAGGGRTLFAMDEPTTGLHAADVTHLLALFDRLIDAGHTVLVVEHNLAVIRAADWVIDLGPEGGSGGGRVVAAGTPADIAGCPGSWTGRALAGALA